jgi:YbbR domain-containing protein
MRYHPFRHLGLKVMAIALASLLWLTVAGEHVVERSLRVPLEFRNIPEALEIVGNTPDSIDVRLRGSSAVLSRVQPGEIVAVLDLSSARSGSRLFHIRNDEVRAPFGVEVAQVLPATLALELEKSARRNVPVVPAIEGDPSPGFIVGKWSADPATVEIIGPDSHVR